MYELLGDAKSAEFYYDEVVYLYPATPVASEVVSQDIHKYLLKGEITSVLASLDELPLVSGDAYYTYGTVKESLATILDDVSSKGEAMEAYRELVEFYPNHSKVRYAAFRLSEEARKNEDWVSAAKYGETLLSTYPAGEETAKIVYDLGTAYSNIGDYYKALGMYQIFILKADRYDTRIAKVKSKISLIQKNYILSQEDIISDEVLKRIIGECGGGNSCAYRKSSFLSCTTNYGAHDPACGSMTCLERSYEDCYCIYECICTNCRADCSNTAINPPPCIVCPGPCAGVTGCTCATSACQWFAGTPPVASYCKSYFVSAVSCSVGTTQYCWMDGPECE